MCPVECSTTPSTLSVLVSLVKKFKVKKTEDSRQKSEDRRQKTEDSRQKTADRRQKTADRRQKTEVSRQKTEDRSQKSEVRRQTGHSTSLVNITVDLTGNIKHKNYLLTQSTNLFNL